jgi:prophage regulatory protein
MSNKLPEILNVIPVSRSSWWAGVKSGKYPKPVKLGENTTAWKAEDIHALISKLSAESEA